MKPEILQQLVRLAVLKYKIHIIKANSCMENQHNFGIVKVKEMVQLVENPFFLRLIEENQPGLA